jgi:AcrR family transcriptional regulator
MTYAEFQQRFQLSAERLYREIYRANREKIQVKKEATVLRNLARIFDATLKISNEKGFAAMSMRDFSRETGLSLGALYTYVASKEELLEMILGQGRVLVLSILEEAIAREADPVARLHSAVRVHLFVSEALQPWFYFSFMEAKNMTRAEKDKTLASEIYTDRFLADILREGQAAGVFQPRDPDQSAQAIKALLQEWYVKRWKFAKTDVSVDRYADFVLEFIDAFHLVSQKAQSNRSHTPSVVHLPARRGASRRGAGAGEVGAAGKEDA